MNRTERVEPIKPKDIMDNLSDVIHPAIITAVNEILKEQYRGNSATIKQKDIISRALTLCPEITQNEIFDKKWMDFEHIFKKAGWDVKYDGPGYRESYDAYFVFSAKK
ncbi:MAG TPA: hypothetical protein VMZ91_11240 [Candidatus Paceibacterota bacterium]|nr:hypothetical protein [Candidatus Paceibacterota bacterium]